MKTNRHLCVKISVAIERLAKGENLFEPATPTQALHELTAATKEGKTYFTGCDRETPEGRCAGHHKVDPEEREIIRHALGLTRSKKAYRNYFCAEPGHQDYPIIERLVEAGMMRKEEGNDIRPTVFIVTEYGQTFA